ncbi:MAG: hypothetical protein R2688_10030 [Fimbriimonadaceae bacterium]
MPIWVWLLIAAAGLCFVSMIVLGFFADKLLDNAVYGEPLKQGTPQSQDSVYERMMTEFLMSERSDDYFNADDRESQVFLKELQKISQEVITLDSADQALMDKAIGELSEQENTDLRYRSEAAHALDFALGYVEFDFNFDIWEADYFGTLENEIPTTNWKAHRGRAKLRSEKELEIARRICDAVMWRVDEELFIRDSDFFRAINSASSSGEDLRDIKRHLPELDWDGNDFRINGMLTKEMSMSQLNVTYWVALERWYALTWALGYGGWKEHENTLAMRWLYEKPLE